MLYLIKDCYQDDNNTYHNVLKIGYSQNSFDSSRKSHYNTHNYGYKFLGEREGSQSLEKYLHKKFSKYKLLYGEWFEYSEKIIKTFWEISENDIYTPAINNQDELNKYIRKLILKLLVPNSQKLFSKYSDNILEEIKFLDNFEFSRNKYTYIMEMLRVFRFVVSNEKEYFEKLDFSLPENVKLLEKYDLLFDRLSDNNNILFKNIILFYYEHKLLENELAKNVYQKNLEEKRDTTDCLINMVYNYGFAQESVPKFETSIKVAKNSRDFISVSNDIKLPYYNKNIEYAHLKSWELYQKDFCDRIANVIKNQESKIYNYSEESKELVQSFLDTKFYTAKFLEEKLNLYCEFINQQGNSSEIDEILISKVSSEISLDNSKTNCDSTNENNSETPILDNKSDINQNNISMLDKSKDDILKTTILNTFKVGERYTLKDIKSMLSTIYKENNIVSKTPKATDLGNYFNLTKIKFYDPETKKRTAGFRLDPL